MDLNTVLRWIGLLGGGVTLFRGIGAFRGGDKLWAVVGALVVGAAGVTYLTAPGYDGFVAAGIWTLLVAVPSVLMRFITSAAVGQKHQRALMLARVFYALHPSEGSRITVIDRRAAMSLANGDLQGAEAAYAEAQKRGGTTATWAEITRLRMLGEWGDLVQYYRARRKAGDEKVLVSFLPAYLRGLGEIGERRELLMEIARNARTLSALSAGDLRALAWLFAFAFAGRRDLVERLLGGSLRQYSRELKEFWLLTADMARGVDGASEKLRALFEVSDAQLRGGIERRLAHESALRLEALSASDEALLAQMEVAFTQEERFGRAAKPRRPVAVFALMLVNFAAYAFELTKGDTTSNGTLLEAGALSAPLVLRYHEWWRLVTCTFLHAGTVHIGMNMLALYVLGPFVERVLGKARFAFVYLGAGVLGSVGILVHDWYRGMGSLPVREADVAVGASGSIMGIVGATMAIALVGWLRERAPIARRQLLGLALLVVAQSSMDLSTPEISFTAHACGLVSGFALAMLVKHHSR